MTKEITGGIKEEKSKLRRNYRHIDDSSFEALKKYFGVEDYAALFRVIKDVGLKDSNSTGFPAGDS